MKSELSTRLERQESLQSPRKQSRYVDSHGKMSEQLFKNAHGISSACFTDGTANYHFPAKKCTRLQGTAYTSQNFSRGGGGDPLEPPAGRSAPSPTASPAFGHRHQLGSYRLGSPAFALFRFYKTTTAVRSVIPFTVL